MTVEAHQPNHIIFLLIYATGYIITTISCFVEILNLLNSMEIKSMNLSQGRVSNH